MNNNEEILRKNVYLESERLLLRPFSLDDAEDMYAYASDPIVTKYLTWQPHINIAQTRKVLNDFFINKPGIYAIVLKQEQRCIGCIHIRIDDRHDKASFGYVLNRDYWNHGYMTEALDQILELAFNKLKLNRVESTHYARNERSGRVMQKAGMYYEGVGRQEVKIKGTYYDVVHYAILRNEWVGDKH
ncbi:MAG: GNAT family N-acetyltransferase [Firmicutes bacterium]|nr:GNAT family N-acetyltransferase [Bacillota bacterium]